MEPAAWEMDFSVSQDNFPTLTLEKWSLYFSSTPIWNGNKIPNAQWNSASEKNLSDVTSLKKTPNPNADAVLMISLTFYLRYFQWPTC